MRIISGSLRGRKLIQIDGTRIRPTADRIREAIFNILGPVIKGKTVLDLFAGTGALGIEALSRGASKAVFVDLSCHVVQQNLDRCRMADRAVLVNIDITGPVFASCLKGQQFDIVFIDPPYEKGCLDLVLNHPRLPDLLAEGCTIVAEQSCRETLKNLPPILDIYRQKKYSKTLISFIHKTEAKDHAPNESKPNRNLPWIF